jgi:hypothetical protein
MRQFLTICLCLLATLTVAADKKTTIAVIPKGTTHEFWKSIHAGAVKAERELGVKTIWKGPIKEDDRQAQINVVEDFINVGVSGIVLAPLDDTALRRFDRGEMRWHEGIWSLLAEAGLLGVALPESAGGSGLGFAALCAVLEQQGRHVAALPLLATTVLGGLPLARFGSAAQQSGFVAQCRVESSSFTRLEENLFYTTAERIRQIFPSRVLNMGQAATLVRNPQALANWLAKYTR